MSEGNGFDLRWLLVLLVAGASFHAGTAEAQSEATSAAWRMTPSERTLVHQGLVSDEARAGGAALALAVGFGSGQAAQGRWQGAGVVFFAGELVSVSLLAGGLACGAGAGDLDGAAGCAVLAWFGLVPLAAFRIAGFVEALVGATNHNRRVRETRSKYGLATGSGRVWIAPALAPVGRHGVVVGARVRL